MHGRMLWGLLLLSVLGASGLACARTRPAPRPPGLPTSMPSEEEASRAAPDAPAAIPPPAGPAPGTAPPGPGAKRAGEPAGPGTDRPLIAPAGPEVPPPDPAAGVLTPEPERTRPGLRVQLLATADPRLARERAEEYRQLFERAVHVRQEGGLYKLQVGDCRTREEAEALRREALALGYGGAFIVETPVAER
jgi:hypothetical protein